MTFQHGCYILCVDAQYVIFSEMLFFKSRRSYQQDLNNYKGFVQVAIKNVRYLLYQTSSHIHLFNEIGFQ